MVSARALHPHKWYFVFTHFRFMIHTVPTVCMVNFILLDIHCASMNIVLISWFISLIKNPGLNTTLGLALSFQLSFYPSLMISESALVGFFLRIQITVFLP